MRNIAIFIVSYFLSEIFVIPDNERRRNLENLNFVIFKKLAELRPIVSTVHRKIFCLKSLISRIPKMSVLGIYSQKSKYSKMKHY